MKIQEISEREWKKYKKNKYVLFVLANISVIINIHQPNYKRLCTPDI